MSRNFRMNDRLWKNGFALIRRFLNVYAWITLGASGFIGVLFAEANRQAFLWEKQDTAVLFLLLAGLSLLGTLAIYWADRRLHGRLFLRGRHFIYLLLVGAAIQIIPPRYIYPSVPDDVFYFILLLLGLGLSWWSLSSPQNGLTNWLWQGTRVLFLIPFVLFFNLMQYPSLPESLDTSPLPLLRPDLRRPPVIVFTFDSIAWIHCMNADGFVRPDLPNLHALQKHSLDWTHARSPGKCTMTSMPNFIFQRDPLVWDQWEWKDDFLQADPLSFTNGLYFLAKQEGYRTSILGMYMPYRRMLGQLLDHAYVLSSYGRFRQTGIPLPSRLNNYLLNIIQHVRGPFPERWSSYFPHLRYANRAYNCYYVEMNHAIESRAQAFFSNSLGPGDFVLIEMPVPHWPYVFLSDGTVSPSANYETHLKYADRVLGGFLDTLRRTGFYDASWILFSSDHGQDYTLNAEKNHVPLLIKPPTGSIQPLRVDTPLNMWEMGPFFHAVFQGRKAEECIALLY